MNQTTSFKKIKKSMLMYKITLDHHPKYKTKRKKIVTIT